MGEKNALRLCNSVITMTEAKSFVVVVNRRILGLRSKDEILDAILDEIRISAFIR